MEDEVEETLRWWLDTDRLREGEREREREREREKEMLSW